MTDITDARVVAGKLSDTERESVRVALTSEWQAGPHLDDTAVMDLAPLRAAKLVERHLGNMTPAATTVKKDGIQVRTGACWWFRLTPLGLAVREILLSEGGEG